MKETLSSTSYTFYPTCQTNRWLIQILCSNNLANRNVQTLFSQTSKCPYNRVEQTHRDKNIESHFETCSSSLTES